MEVELRHSLSWYQIEVSTKIHSPAVLTLKKNKPYWLGAWLGSIAGLSAVEQRRFVCSYWESNPGLPDHSQYRLSYTGSILVVKLEM
jgi:hypothetical protein